MIPAPQGPLGICTYGQTHDVRKVELRRRLVGGLSGAMTLDVRPHDFRGPLRPRVFKKASIYELAEEYRGYVRFIEPYMSRGFARIERTWVTDGADGAISYEYAGNRYDPEEGSIVTLEKLLHDGQSVERIPQLIHDVYSAMRHLHGEPPWEAHRSRRTLWDVWRYFRQELLPIPFGDVLPRGPDYELEVVKVKGDWTSPTLDH